MQIDERIVKLLSLFEFLKAKTCKEKRKVLNQRGFLYDSEGREGVRQ